MMIMFYAGDDDYLYVGIFNNYVLFDFYVMFLISV